ncbi:PAS domain-containing sensor histidine kinase [candidate division WOR-3 bacterium]|uniref:histidine kinase n=1 Tax=candidate division WOR-3 bacterium TaxID=2052148 RepID=A0A660SJC2_UNCW3|nr:MAG: PAS domain-containing sensor histidine kinase [candidate division WOR-3 bacterium]
MRLTIKHFLCYCLIVAITSPLLALLVNRQIRVHYLTVLQKNLKAEAEAIKDRLLPSLRSEDSREIDSIVDALGKRMEIRITVIGIGGWVLGDSRADPEKMENHADRPEIIQALQSGAGKSIRFSATMGEDMLYVAIPVEEDGRCSWVIRTSLSLREVNILLRSLNSRILYITIIITIFALVLALFSSRSLTRPISRMIKVTQDIARGNFGSRLHLEGGDELAQLSIALNRMAQDLGRLFSEIEMEREKVHTILTSIREGLVVLDSDKKILLANENFNELCGLTENPVGKYFWEALRNVEFNRLIEAVIDKEEPRTREIEVAGKIFIANSAPLPDGGVVVVIHDVTRIKQVEKIKADFVANVSHELRTPLTAIKGFVETLEREIPSKQRRFLAIIKRHTDRLINIVADLLLLARLERHREMLEIEEVDLAQLVSDISVMYNERIKRKGLELKISIPRDLVVKADPFLLQQLLINLLDNALKYTEEGEITIVASPADGGVIIKVADTGIGIPEEHLPRIFERFYTVDKARSRKLGGTGLGLSIVKHIVQLHRGKIEVESSLAEGTTFIITLP